MNTHPHHGPIPPEGYKVIPAATVVIFRKGEDGGEPELLMVQRAKEMRFAGGAAVFPGGRMDPEDRELAQQLDPDGDQEVISAKIAGIRETLEETGLLIALRESVSGAQAAEARAILSEGGALAPVLEHFGWHLDLDRLVWFAHWCPAMDKAFDTRFFLADLGTGAVDVAVDATENTRLFWTSAANALEMADAGEISIIYPTRRNLERLALFADFEQACAQTAEFPPYRIAPKKIDREGERWLMIPDDQGYPVLGQPIATAKRG
jgi:8-oxo-dGTP pyrophosphatase MutT (NUDIX family)